MCDMEQSPLKKPELNGNGYRKYEEANHRPVKLKTKILVTSVIALVILSALSGFFIGRTEYKASKNEPLPGEEFVNAADPIEARPPSSSWPQDFKRAAVCADSPKCSEVGRYILSINGSAVDATIASMFCNGLHNMPSTGMGGGFIMTVYIKEERKGYSVIAREKAPAAATPDMFHGDLDAAYNGPLAVGVPGELRGLWTAYKRWGKLPWKTLLQPTLKFCKHGIVLRKAVYERILFVPESVNVPQLRDMYYDPVTKELKPPGSLLKPCPVLCKTLQIIAEEGGDVIYNGSLAGDFANDLKKLGTIITADDLKNYNAKIVDSITAPFTNGDVIYTTPPPGSGAILVNILNILKNYKFTPESVNGSANKILTYHRIIEAFKYAYAARTKLADTDFVNVDELLKNLTSPEYADAIYRRINDEVTNNNTEYYGAEGPSRPDHGTAHLSVLAENGDAVSVTSSINNYFGAGIVCEKTGLILNDVMDDFSCPGFNNFYGVRPSPANFIEPGKRPQSSMSGTVIVDRNGNPRFVIGASGGTKITTSIALTVMRILWFGKTVKEAVDEPRIHHQVFPMRADYEYGVTQDMVKGLRAKGHEMFRYQDHGSIVCALFRNGTRIYGNADFRKEGDVCGLD